MVSVGVVLLINSCAIWLTNPGAGTWLAALSVGVGGAVMELCACAGLVDWSGRGLSKGWLDGSSKPRWKGLLIGRAALDAVVLPNLRG